MVLYVLVGGLEFDDIATEGGVEAIVAYLKKHYAWSWPWSPHKDNGIVANLRWFMCRGSGAVATVGKRGLLPP